MTNKIDKYGINWLAFTLLFTLAFIWGSSFILIKRGLMDPEGNLVFSPIQLGALRMAIACLVILPFVLKKIRLLFTHKGKFLLITGLLGNGIPAYLFAKAETQIGSAVTGALNATTPLFAFIIATLIFSHQVKTKQLIGVILGLLGAVLLGLEGSSDLNWNFYFLFVLLATLFYGISVNVIKSCLSELTVIEITGLGLVWVGIPSIIYLFASDFTTVLKTIDYAPKSLGFIAILACVGTTLALIVFNKLIKITNAIYASTVAYLIPVVALGWGWLDGEIITITQMLWILLILSGVYLVNKSTSKL